MSSRAKASTALSVDMSADFMRSVVEQELFLFHNNLLLHVFLEVILGQSP